MSRSRAPWVGIRCWRLPDVRRVAKVEREIVHRREKTMLKLSRILILSATCGLAIAAPAGAQVPRDCADDARDHVRCLQTDAMAKGKAAWAHWGVSRNRYAGWIRHSNRLVPVYTFGVSLEGFAGRQSVYRDQ